jgi:competence ComEA-like helix-hairpin-helix protein
MGIYVKNACEVCMDTRLVLLIISAALLTVKLADSAMSRISPVVADNFETSSEKIAKSKKDFHENRTGKKTKGERMFTLGELNRSSVEELQEIKGIGPKTARSIRSFIKIKGPIRRVESLMDVKGIGKVRLSQIKKQIVGRK